MDNKKEQSKHLSNPPEYYIGTFTDIPSKYMNERCWVKIDKRRVWPFVIVWYNDTTFTVKAFSELDDRVFGGADEYKILHREAKPYLFRKIRHYIG